MGLFDGTPLQRPVTCERCERPLPECSCPRDAGGSVLLPGEQQAVVRIERRRGRAVTIIEGLDPAASDLPGIARLLKSACGAGGTARDGAIEVQGDQREAVAAELREMGYRVRT